MALDHFIAENIVSGMPSSIRPLAHAVHPPEWDGFNYEESQPPIGVEVYLVNMATRKGLAIDGDSDGAAVVQRNNKDDPRNKWRVEKSDETGWCVSVHSARNVESRVRLMQLCRWGFLH